MDGQKNINMYYNLLELYDLSLWHAPIVNPAPVSSFVP